MDDCRRCGAPLTDNGCEYCGDGRIKVRQNIFPDHGMTKEMAGDAAAIVTRNGSRYYFHEISEDDRLVSEEERAATRWEWENRCRHQNSQAKDGYSKLWVWLLCIAWAIGFVAVLANIPKDDPRAGLNLEPGQVEFVSVETTSFGMDVNAGSCDGPGDVVAVRSNRVSNHFYNRRTSH